MTFSGEAGNSLKNNQLNFGGDRLDSKVFFKAFYRIGNRLTFCILPFFPMSLSTMALYSLY